MCFLDNDVVDNMSTRVEILENTARFEPKISKFCPIRTIPGLEFDNMAWNKQRSKKEALV